MGAWLNSVVRKLPQKTFPQTRFQQQGNPNTTNSSHNDRCKHVFKQVSSLKNTTTADFPDDKGDFTNANKQIIPRCMSLPVSKESANTEACDLTHQINPGSCFSHYHTFCHCKRGKLTMSQSNNFHLSFLFYRIVTFLLCPLAQTKLVSCSFSSSQLIFCSLCAC